MNTRQVEDSPHTASDTGKMHYAIGILLLVALLIIPVVLRVCGFVPLS